LEENTIVEAEIMIPVLLKVILVYKNKKLVSLLEKSGGFDFKNLKIINFEKEKSYGNGIC